MPLLEGLGLKDPGRGKSGDDDAPAKGKKSEAERADAAAFKRFEAFAKRVDAELDKAKLAVDAQPVAAIKATLEADSRRRWRSRCARPTRWCRSRRPSGSSSSIRRPALPAEGRGYAEGSRRGEGRGARRSARRARRRRSRPRSM